MNILEIIKKAPEDHVYWCTLIGECKVRIATLTTSYPIIAIANSGSEYEITKSGRYFYAYPDAECVLFPSKDNRDWAAFDRELDGFSTSISLELKGEEEQKFIKGLLSTFTACAEINLDHSYYDEHPLIDFRVNGKKYSVSVGKIRELVLRDGENLKEESNDKGTDR